MGTNQRSVAPGAKAPRRAHRERQPNDAECHALDRPYRSALARLAARVWFLENRLYPIPPLAKGWCVGTDSEASIGCTCHGTDYAGCDDRSRASTWGRGKRGQQHQAIGRSRGGITTKIHAIVDALGYPLCYRLTAGHQHDCVMGYEMLQNMELTDTTVIADRGYDMNNILESIEKQDGVAVIPSRKHRKEQRDCDWWLYKECHLVEALFNRLKHYRRLATRYDKLACSFMAFLSLASIMLWIR